MATAFERWEQTLAELAKNKAKPEDVEKARIALRQKVIEKARQEDPDNSGMALALALSRFDNGTRAQSYRSGLVKEPDVLTEDERSGVDHPVLGGIKQAAKELVATQAQGWQRIAGSALRLANDFGENEKGTWLDRAATSMEDAQKSTDEFAGEGYATADGVRGFGKMGLQNAPILISTYLTGGAAAGATSLAGRAAGLAKTAQGAAKVANAARWAGAGGAAAAGFSGEYGDARQQTLDKFKSITPEQMRESEKYAARFKAREKELYLAGAAPEDAAKQAYEETVDALSETDANIVGVVNSLIEFAAPGASKFFLGGGKLSSKSLANAKKFVNLDDVKDVSKQFGQEFLQEGFTSAVTDDTRAKAMNEDVNWGQVGKDALVGGTLGAIMGGGAQFSTGQSTRQRALAEIKAQEQQQGQDTQLGQAAQARKAELDAIRQQRPLTPEEQDDADVADAILARSAPPQPAGAPQQPPIQGGQPAGTPSPQPAPAPQAGAPIVGATPQPAGAPVGSNIPQPPEPPQPAPGLSGVVQRHTQSAAPALDTVFGDAIKGNQVPDFTALAQQTGLDRNALVDQFNAKRTEHVRKQGLMDLAEQGDLNALRSAVSGITVDPQQQDQLIEEAVAGNERRKAEALAASQQQDAQAQQQAQQAAQQQADKDKYDQTYSKMLDEAVAALEGGQTEVKAFLPIKKKYSASGLNASDVNGVIEHAKQVIAEKQQKAARHEQAVTEAMPYLQSGDEASAVLAMEQAGVTDDADVQSVLKEANKRIRQDSKKPTGTQSVPAGQQAAPVDQLSAAVAEVKAAQAAGKKINLATIAKKHGVTILDVAKGAAAKPEQEALKAKPSQPLALPAPQGTATPGDVMVSRNGKVMSQAEADALDAVANTEKKQMRRDMAEEAGNPTGIPTGMKPKVEKPARTEQKAVLPHLILRTDGKPFPDERQASRALARKKLENTHEVVPVDGGSAIAPKGAGRESLIEETNRAFGDWYRANKSSISEELVSGGLLDGIELRSLPADIRNRSAHGMAKDNTLRSLRKLLNDGIDTQTETGGLFTASLSSTHANAGAGSGTASGSAYTDGPFILVGRSGVGKITNLSQIDAIVVNQALPDSVLEGLQSEYPDFKFVRSDTLESAISQKKTATDTVSNQPDRAKSNSGNKPVAKNGNAKNQVDPEKDDILTAIAKLGGIDRAQAKSQGVDPADFSRRAGGIQFVFRKNGGKTLDGMAEALSEMGYPVTENGDYTINALLDSLDAALRGSAVGTPIFHEARARAEYEAQYEEEMAQAAINDTWDSPGSSSEPDWLSFGADDFVSSILDGDITPNAVIASELAGIENERTVTGTPEAAGQKVDSSPAPSSGAKGIAAAAGGGTEWQQKGKGDSQPDSAVQDFGLKAQTEAERLAEEQRQAADLEAKRKEEEKARLKAQADREISSFTLTGSDLPADVAMAAGQNDLFAPRTRGEKAAKAASAPAAEPVKWFGSRDKADAWIAKNGPDYHVVQAGPSRFEVFAGKETNAFPVGKDGLPARKSIIPKSTPDALLALTGGDQIVFNSGTEFEETVWIEENRARKTWVIKTRSGRAIITEGPVGPDRQWGWGKNDAAAKAVEGKRYPSNLDAPGTRYNTSADRAAAERLQKLLDSFMANRGTPEGAARDAIRSVIEELRKPKTTSSIVSMLETASNRLMRQFPAQAEVVDGVIESLGAQAAPAEDLDSMFDDVLAEVTGNPQVVDTPKASVESVFTGEPDPKNSAPMQELDGFAVGDKVSIANRSVSEGVIRQLFTRESAGSEMRMARVEVAGGKSLDLLTDNLSRQERTAGQAAVSAAKNTGMALGDAIDGLGKLFGGKGTLGSGLVFDEETYAKAKPYFIAAIAHLRAAGGDLREAMRAVVKMVVDKFGADAAGNMKPYVVRFIADVRDGKIDDNAAGDATGKSLTDTLYQHLKNGTLPKDNNGLRKLVAEFDGGEVDNTRLKVAQENLEAAIVMHSRDIAAAGGTDKEIFSKLLDVYSSQPNLNIRTSTSMENQAYSTPAPLAFLASRLAGINGNTVVLEPTAGTGMLLMGADPKNSFANELNPGRADILRAQGFNPTTKDAATDELVPSGKKIDAVITNPPFGSVKDADGKATKVSVDGYKIGKIDHLIAARALDAMSGNGKATLIIGADKVAGGVSTDDRIFFNWLYSHYNVTGHFEIDGDLYKRQGAGWPVRVITINGRARSSNVSPMPGTIQRVNNWSEAYDQYSQVLGAQNSGTESGVVTGSKSTGQSGNDAAAAQNTDGQEGGGVVRQRNRTRGKGGPSNVGGTSSGTVRNQQKGASEKLADSSNVQRPDERTNAQDQLEPGDKRGVAPAGRNQGNAGGADAAKSAGGALVDADNAFQTKYIPRSARKDDGVLVPINMAQPTQDSLSVLEDAVGDIDQYAANELGYDSVEELHDALMGLQVDSVASAIYQIKERGKGVIIADQTGIGKGRQAAAIIRWSHLNGYIPVFVTVKPSLFTDMYNDLADIGSNDIEPFIVNKEEWISSHSGDRMFTNKQNTHGKTLQKIANTGLIPEGRNAIFVTYSQINKDNVQRNVLNAVAPNAVFILDESHNAGGDSGTGDFIRSAIAPARGVTYLSATFAKRPDNMPLYFRTDIGDAIGDGGNLMSAMESGGLPLQTVVSNNLVSAGQMFRRERSYDGVNIDTIIDTENRDSHEQLSDAVTEALRRIVAADRAFHNGYVRELKKQMKALGSSIEDSAGNNASESVDHTEFSSVVHNFIRQMLLGMKADTAANEAIAAIKRGDKPLLALENTMGSFLNEYAANNNLSPGQSLGDFDYRTVLSRALDKSRYIIFKDDKGNKEKQYVPIDDLDPATREVYDEAQSVIDGLDINIPVSPLDWMRYRIEESGYTVAEITGRELAVDYSKARPVLTHVPASERMDKVNTTRMFNDGRLDAIILNVAGSTGISLHASEKFKDQRKRHMIVVQPAQDINIFMQMLGRIHRTGQVKLPSYAILNADLPTEKRPTALLNKKMKSLNANTSSNTESATSIKSQDMLNKYGDQVIGNYLLEHPELAMEIDVHVDEDGVGKVDLSRTVTGRMALMPVSEQKDFYTEVEDQYNNLIEYLNETNQNELEPRTFDFEAEVIKEATLVEATDPTSPFGQEAVYGEYKIKAQGKQMTPDEVKSEYMKHLSGKTGSGFAEDMINDLLDRYAAQLNAFRRSHGIGKTLDAEKYEAWLKRAFGYGVEGSADRVFVEKMLKRAVDQYAAGEPLVDITRSDLRTGEAKGISFIEDHEIGSAWRVDINGDVYNAVITNVRNTHKGVGSPFSMSKIQVTLAVNGPIRTITIPASQWNKVEVSKLYIGWGLTIDGMFRDQVEGSGRAKIITGNLLAAYGELKDTKGTIINFTKKDGSIAQGILLPRKFDFKTNTRGDFMFRSAADAFKFLSQSRDANVGRFGISSRDAAILVIPVSDGIKIIVPKSKARGGKYFLDKKLIAMVGDFVSDGNGMVVRVNGAKASEEALKYLMVKSPLYAIPSLAEEARSILGLPPAEAKLSVGEGSGPALTTTTAREILAADPVLSKALPFIELKSATENIPAGAAKFLPAYHGSPFKFDKFSLDHMGKGEGAQAYGWGLYFAGNKAVADWYREVLSAFTDSFIPFQGREYDYSEGSPDAPALVSALADYYGVSRRAATGAVVAIRENLGVIPAYSHYTHAVENKTQLQKEIHLLLTILRNGVEVKPKGQLYRAEIPEDNTMLHWDKPLSEQPESVRRILADKRTAKAFAKYAIRNKGLIDAIGSGELEGWQAYQSLVIAMGSQEKASKFLGSIGISGIKYLDGASRSKGEGNYNYVVFDDSAVRILETYYSAGQSGGPEGYYHNGKITLFPENIKANATQTAEERLKWVAFHEVTHRGVANLAESKEYMAELQRAGKNPFIKNLAKKIHAKRQGTPYAVSMEVAIEEALAEAWAALQTGSSKTIKAQYGLHFPLSIRPRAKSAIARFFEVVKRIYNKLTGRGLTNEQVAELLLKTHEAGMLPDGTNPSGRRDSFAGENAETADLTALDKAKQRIAAGEDAEAVRKDTGWHTGVDGKWRFEIDDSKAYIKGKGSVFGKPLKANADIASIIGANKDSPYRASAKLGSILHHPDLFRAYPDLANVEVWVEKEGSGSDGMFSPDSNIITVRGSLSGIEAVSVILHEIQHAIQENEGFAAGGNIRDMGRRVVEARFEVDDLSRRLQRIENEAGAEADLWVAKYPDRVNDALDYLRKQGMFDEGDNIRDAVKYAIHDRDPSYQSLTKQWRQAKEAAQQSPTESYKRLAGEVEARNTQARANMTASERNATSPQSTADVAERDQIVIFSKGLAEMVSDKPTGAEITEAQRQLEEQLAIADRMIAERGGLFAPNGERSKLNRMQWAQVRTANFKRWFGDWEGDPGNASSVVDDNGEPKIVYHSGDSGLTEIRKSGRFGGIFVLPTGAPRYRAQEYQFFLRGEALSLDDMREKLDSLDDGGLSIYQSYISGKEEATDDDVDSITDALTNGSDYPDDQRVWDILGAIDEADAQVEIQRLRGKVAAKLGYGAVQTPDEHGMDTIMVTDSKQIKSATGNAGTFSGKTDDIRYSVPPAPGQPPGRFQFVSTAQQWMFEKWTKTLGTQLNTAMLEPLFKPTYDLVQRYLQHTNNDAYDAISVAPNLLGRLEDINDYGREIKNIGKFKKINADREAAAVPLFEGTRFDKKVYSDAVLKRVYNLTDDQVAVYREARAAIEASLDSHAKSVITKILLDAGAVEFSDIDTLVNRDLPADDYMEELRQRLDADILAANDAIAIQKTALSAAGVTAQDKASIQASIKKGSRRVELLEEAAKRIDSTENTLSQLKREGYFPLMRWGKYTVTVTDAGGKVVDFRMVETIGESKKLEAALTQQYHGQGMTVEKGSMSENRYKNFTGISPETLALFAKEWGVDNDEAYQEYLKLALPGQSALKRRIHRKGDNGEGIAGFSMDIQRTLAAFVMGNARHSARNIYGSAITQAVEAIPKNKGTAYDVAFSLADFVTNPDENSASVSIRNMLFIWNMGFSVAFGALNLTQPWMMTLPWLSQFSGAVDVAGFMGKAAKTAAIAQKNGTVPQEYYAEYQRAVREGHVDPQNVFMLQGIERGGSGLGSSLLKTVSHGMGMIAAATESYNRKLTLFAALDVARAKGPQWLKSKGFDSAYAFAVQAVAETQGVYNKGNRPGWSRNPIGAVLLVFKQYAVNWIEMAVRMGRNHYGDDRMRKGLMMMLGLLFAMAGGMGMPFAEDLKDIAETAMGSAGKPINIERQMQMTLGKGMADTVLAGPINAMVFNSLGIDMHGRMSMGNLIPGTGALNPYTSTDAKLSEGISVMGAGTGLLKKGSDAVAAAQDGRFLDAAQSAAPRAIESVMKGVRMMAEGKARDARGNVLMETTPWDAAAKIIDFQPASVAITQRERGRRFQDKNIQMVARASLRNRLITAYEEKDADKIRDAEQALDEWNQDNPLYQIKLKKRDLRKAAKKRGSSWLKREETPKGLEWIDEYADQENGQ